MSDNEFSTFCERVANFLNVPPQVVSETRSIVEDLQLTEISLFGLVLELQRTNPHFAIPEQVSPLDVSIGDLYHFFITMGEGHGEVR